VPSIDELKRYGAREWRPRSQRLCIQPLSPSDPVCRVLRELKSEPALNVFDGMWQEGPGRQVRCEWRHLLLWVLRRAMDIGPDCALQDLSRYVDAVQLPCDLALVVDGIVPDRPHDPGHGIVVLPWADLPDSPEKRGLSDATCGGSVASTQAAFIRSASYPKRHALEHQPLPPPDFTDLDDALLCAAVAGPGPLARIASFVSVPSWVPAFFQGQWHGSFEQSYLQGRPCTNERLERTAQLCGVFCTLDQHRREGLRLAMERFNLAMRSRSLVDAATDLGTAMEALFLTDVGERGELTFRLRVRGARFLAAGVEERKRIFALLADLYSLRSAAVHTGRVAPMLKGTDSWKVIVSTLD
jgi:hypothetical protein